MDLMKEETSEQNLKEMQGILSMLESYNLFSESYDEDIFSPLTNDVKYDTMQIEKFLQQKRNEEFLKLTSAKSVSCQATVQLIEENMEFLEVKSLNLSLKDTSQESSSEINAKYKNLKTKEHKPYERNQMLLTAFLNKTEAEINKLLSKYYERFNKEPRISFSNLKLKKRIVGKKLLKELSEVTYEAILRNENYTEDSHKNVKLFEELRSSTSDEARACLEKLSQTYQNSFRRFLNDESSYVKNLAGKFDWRHTVIKYYCKHLDLTPQS